MTEELLVDLCTRDDVTAVRTLVDEHWRKGHVLAADEDLLRWQFASQRMAQVERGGLSVVLAREDDTLVGMVGLIPFDMAFEGNLRRGAWLANWLALKSARTKLVGIKLMDFVPKLGFDVRGAVGLAAQVQGLYRSMGFDVLKETPRWLALLEGEISCEILSRTNAGSTLEELRDFVRDHRVVASTPVAEGIAIDEVVGPLNAEWDHFWSQVLFPEFIGGCRDSAYLNWRFGAHPRFAYRILTARQKLSGELCGAAVFRLEQVSEPSCVGLRLVDLLARDSKVVQSLSAAVIEAGRRAGATFVDFFCTSVPIGCGLQENGFLRHNPVNNEIRFPSRFQPIDSGGGPLSCALWASAGWRHGSSDLFGQGGVYITTADADMDRPN